ncbi:MAG: Co2+/Mg2+ efflux protein ApaG [Bacteroidota bacterium]
MSLFATNTTHGVKISVQSVYQPELSHQNGGKYVFAYQVTIENQNDFAVQLLRRHWFIYDSLGEKREVEGFGVIGKQPVIPPGGAHQYVSGSAFDSDFGAMHGTYLMMRVLDDQQFRVVIPEFHLIAPQRLN